MVCQLAYIPKNILGACGRTRTYEVTSGRLIYSQVLLLLSHTCKIKFVMLKIDEGREKRTANTLRGTLLLRMATLDTPQSNGVVIR
jgi:hypothetical protein